MIRKGVKKRGNKSNWGRDFNPILYSPIFQWHWAKRQYVYSTKNKFLLQMIVASTHKLGRCSKCGKTSTNKNVIFLDFVQFYCGGPGTEEK